MALNLPPKLSTFQDEVRHFCREILPQHLRIKSRTERFSLGTDDQKQFTRLLYEQGGWSCPGWPFHLHYGQEELFVVLAGEGTLRYDDSETPIRTGDVIFAPTGDGSAMNLSPPRSA